jgi:hypothetical protein
VFRLLYLFASSLIVCGALTDINVARTFVRVSTRNSSRWKTSSIAPSHRGKNRLRPRLPTTKVSVSSTSHSTIVCRLGSASVSERVVTVSL